MKLTKQIFLILGCLILVFGVTLNSCKKDQFLTDSNKELRFSTDTLTFDTVFTSLGTVTKSFKVINPFNRDIKISNIRLKNTSSVFKLNINGIPGSIGQDIIIGAKDSFYIFVAATINPTSDDIPFIYSDDVVFEYNGRSSSVNVMAWGQNAYFHYGEVISGNVIWDNRKPHVLVGKTNTDGLFVPGVIVNCGSKLTIDKGCRIYCFSNAGIYSWGTLEVNGSKEDTVIFQGVRLESYFNQLPGQWQGIAILRGHGSCSSAAKLSYCTIDESSFGILAGTDTTAPDAFDNLSRPKLELNACLIKNCGFGQFQAGGFPFGGLNGFNADFKIENTIIYNTTGNAVLLILGGKYFFNHCTIYNGGSTGIQHQETNFLASNFIQSGLNVFTNSFDSVHVLNTIIYGSLDEEISLNVYESTPTTDLRPRFENSLLKTKLNTDTIGFYNVTKNQNPLFKDAYRGNFILNSGSPCIDRGAPTSATTDFTGSSRSSGSAPDIGAIEFQ